MQPLAFFDRAMMGHDPGPSHPECPDRLRAIEAALDGADLALEAAGEADRDALLRVHEADYVDRILALRDEETSLDADTHVSAGSVRAALLAAGSAVAAVDATLDDGAAPFALIRPPGHHAEAGRAMGFCLFNSVAVAAAHARHARGLERVLVLDWDVHHGNGTEHMFEDASDVLFISTHQHPHYPGTGAATDVGKAAGRGFTVNVPMESGCTDGDMLRVFDDLIDPVVDQFAPQLILVSAGFDAHREDPLGGQRLTDEGFAAMCGRVQAMARRHAQGRLALLLEGGYAITALARSVAACLEVLAGDTAPPGERQTTAAGERALRNAVSAQQPFWKL
ncbi:MAG: histone deacetylase [Myxococcota bacterium]